MLNNLDVARSVGAANALLCWAIVEVLAGNRLRASNALQGYLRASSGTTFHAAETCRIGADELDVVDTSLRVHGIEALRVVDASVMPEIVNADLNATALAIAENAADDIGRH